MRLVSVFTHQTEAMHTRDCECQRCTTDTFVRLDEQYINGTMYQLKNLKQCSDRKWIVFYSIWEDGDKTGVGSTTLERWNSSLK